MKQDICIGDLIEFIVKHKKDNETFEFGNLRADGSFSNEWYAKLGDKKTAMNEELIFALLDLIFLMSMS